MSEINNSSLRIRQLALQFRREDQASSPEIALEPDHLDKAYDAVFTTVLRAADLGPRCVRDGQSLVRVLANAPHEIIRSVVLDTDECNSDRLFTRITPFSYGTVMDASGEPTALLRWGKFITGGYRRAHCPTNLLRLFLEPLYNDVDGHTAPFSASRDIDSLYVARHEPSRVIVPFWILSYKDSAGTIAPRLVMAGGVQQSGEETQSEYSAEHYQQGHNEKLNILKLLADAVKYGRPEYKAGDWPYRDVSRSTSLCKPHR